MTTPLRKAAIVLSSLPPSDAARLRRLLAPGLSRRLTAEVARVERERRAAQGRGSVEQRLAEQASALWEFAAAHPQADLRVELDIRFAGKKLRTFRPADTGQSPAHGWSPLGRQPFESLGWSEPAELMTALGKEQPQTLAVVLAYVPPALASELFRRLPLERRASVLLRTLQLQPVPEEVLQHLEQAVLARLNVPARADRDPAGNPERIAALIQSVTPAEQESLLEKLARRAPRAAREVRQRLLPPEAPGRRAS